MSSGPHILEVILEKSTLRKAAPIRLAAFPLSGSVALGPSQHRIGMSPGPDPPPVTSAGSAPTPAAVAPPISSTIETGCDSCGVNQVAEHDGDVPALA